MQCFNGLIGFVHTGKAVCDVLINRKLALHALFHQDGYILARLESAKGRPFPYTTRHELERAGRNLVARSRYTDDAGGPWRNRKHV